MSLVLVSDAEHALHMAEQLQALLVERFPMALPLLTVSCRILPGLMLSSTSIIFQGSPLLFL